MAQVDTPDWHSDAYPELRPARPWVMQEMIESEPELTTRMASVLPGAGDIAGMVLRAARSAEPIVVVGCGTSEHGAMAIAVLLQRSLRAAGQATAVVEPRQSLEAALDPRHGGLCLAVSHDGGTRATVLALEAAQRSGGQTAVITAQPESASARLASRVIVTPMVDRSWCHTVAYLSAILAGEAIASAIENRSFEATALSSHVSRCLDARVSYDLLAAQLSGTRTFVVCGTGADYVTSREIALKIEEAARIPAYAYPLETVLHGHLVAHDERDALIVFVTDPDGGDQVIRRATLLSRAVNRIGLRLASVLSTGADKNLPEDVTPAGRIVLPNTGDRPATAASLVGSALALQLLTLSITHDVGVNPDLIRREEAPYREAATLAEKRGNW